jgi:1-acyl-sn-glycerol-3-phosphate acyltransferase
MIRGILFAPAYYLLSLAYVLMATLSMVWPDKFITRWIVRRYSMRMVTAMRWFAGIRIHYAGLDNLPSGPFILAPKHQSWGDGFVSFSKVDDLVFVTGDHLEKIPLLKGLLARIGAIVVDNCGGGSAKEDLNRGAARAFQEGRRILIYPEGHLSRPGEHHRYRAGIWHLYHDHGVPVVPAATNLGHFWQQQDFAKKAGLATVEFLEPIPPGLDRDEFMSTLETRIELHTQVLAMVASDDMGYPQSQLVAFKGEVERAQRA